MPAAPPAAAPTDLPGPHEDRPIPVPGRPGCARLLLGLVHRLIGYGKSLTGVLQRPEAAADPTVIMMNFGTRDFALIAARITRGLLLAVALEARLLGRVAIEDKRAKAAAPAQPPANAPAPVRVRSPRKPRPADDPTSLLARMPTAEEIAAQIRRRPIGAVLADICSDLGIVASHPLWRELRNAVSFNGGSFRRFVQNMFDRTTLVDFVPLDASLPPMPPGWRPPPRVTFADMLAAGLPTGPP